MAKLLPTTEITVTTPWGMGKSGSETRPGFAQTDSSLPASADMWKNYFSNVMRGDTDGPWFTEGYTTSLDYSRTYSDESSVGESPPEITYSSIDGVLFTGKLGNPMGGWQPTIASPGEGNGVNPSALPVMPMVEIKLSDTTAGRGLGINGSLEDPLAGSQAQASCVSGDGLSHNYFAGYSGYSNPSGT